MQKQKQKSYFSTSDSFCLITSYFKLGVQYPLNIEWYFYDLRGYCTSYPKKALKLAWFVLYLKIINIFLKNDICIL